MPIALVDVESDLGDDHLSHGSALLLSLAGEPNAGPSPVSRRRL